MHILIFSGYNQRAVIAFLRTLTQNGIFNYSIIARDCEDTILKTQYKDKVFYVRDSKELYVADILNLIDKLKEVYKCKKIFFAPTTEYLNRFLLEYRNCIEAQGGIIPLAEKETYIKVSDKEAFQKICESKGLLIPKQIEFPRVFEKPFVAKPKKYMTDNGKINAPVLITNLSEYQNFIKEYETDGFYFQEYIWGRSIYLLFYFSLEGNYFTYSQENVLQQPYGKSIVAAKYSDVYKKQICKQYVELFEALKFRGLVMVELREVNKKYYMIEANPRFWGPSQFFVDSEINFFEYLLSDYKYDISDKEKKLQTNEDVKYLWSGGINEYTKDLLVKYSDFNLEEYIKCDIYNREDTREIYEQECR